MKISEKHKKWLTKKSIKNCFLLSLAILVIALFFGIAQLVVASGLPIIQKILFFFFVWGLLSALIWFVGFSNPDVAEVVFKMLGFEEQEQNKSQERSPAEQEKDERMHASKHSRFGLEILTYGIISVLLIIFSFFSLSRLSVQSDTLLVGLASILAFYTIAMLLLRSFSKRLRRFKFGPTGLEAELEKMEEEALEVKVERTPQEVREEIDEIERSDRDPSVVFLELVGEIEKKLRMIAEWKDFTGYKYSPVRKLVSALIQKGVISQRLGALVHDFWGIRNRIVHGEMEITESNLKNASSIGEIVLTELEKIYEQTKTYRLRVKCKTCGIEFFSGISTTKSAFESSTYKGNIHRCPEGHENSYNKEDYILEDC